jgi:hypothetical protein
MPTIFHENLGGKLVTIRQDFLKQLFEANNIHSKEQLHAAVLSSSIVLAFLEK